MLLAWQQHSASCMSFCLFRIVENQYVIRVHISKTHRANMLIRVHLLLWSQQDADINGRLHMEQHTGK